MYIRRWIDALCVCVVHMGVMRVFTTNVHMYIGRQIGVSAHVQMYSGDQLLQ